MTSQSAALTIQSTVEAYVRSALPALAKLDGKYVEQVTFRLSGDHREASLTARSPRPKSRSVIFVAETLEFDFCKNEPYAAQIAEYQHRVDEFLRNNPPPYIESAKLVRVSSRPASPVKPVFMQHEIAAIRAGIEAVVPVTAHWSGFGASTGGWEITITETLEKDLRP